MLAAGLSDFLDLDSAWPEPAAIELGSVVPGLVHHWNLDEGPDWHDDAFLAVSSASVAHDSVGGNDAVLMQMGGDSWVSGQQFTGLEFDGSEDYLGAGEDLGAVLGGDASLAFWVRTEQAGAPKPTRRRALRDRWPAVTAAFSGAGSTAQAAWPWWSTGSWRPGPRRRSTMDSGILWSSRAMRPAVERRPMWTAA